MSTALPPVEFVAPAKASTNGNGQHSADPTLPVIEVTNRELRDVSDDGVVALQAANDPPHVFRNGGALVRVVIDDEGAHLDAMGRAALRGRLTRVANWRRVRETKDGPKYSSCDPPLAVVDDIAALPDLELPRLIGVVRCPVMAPDGVVHAERGYSPSTSTWYEPVAGFALPPIADDPGAKTIAAARTLIADELLGDFPFAGDAERAHAIGLLLLPFVRTLVAGPTPLHLLEAPTPGTGKGLLAQAALYPALGEAVPTRPAVTDEEEWRKLITSLLLRGQPVALFDNLRHPLDSAHLAAALTTTRWEDRQLGVNRDLVLPVRTIWVATGNNPVTSSEIARRTVRIRLDSHTERPWERSGYRHPDLLAWAKRRRPDLAAATLTLAKAWHAAGRPGPAAEANPFGGFESWRHTIGGILHVAGIDGFLANRAEQYDTSDGEHAAWAALVDQWWARHQDRAVSVSDLWSIVADLDGFDLGEQSEQSRRTRFGNLLRGQRDRIIGGRRIIDAGTYKGAKTYKLGHRDGSGR